MSVHSADEVKRHVRTYLMVFAALAILTVITVAISTVHLPSHRAIALALVVAVIKAALVALFFMHLASERRIIYATLALCAVFLAALLFGPILTEHEFIHWANTQPRGGAHVS